MRYKTINLYINDYYYFKMFSFIQTPRRPFAIYYSLSVSEEATVQYVSELWVCNISLLIQFTFIIYLVNFWKNANLLCIVVVKKGFYFFFYSFLVWIHIICDIIVWDLSIRLFSFKFLFSVFFFLNKNDRCCNSVFINVIDYYFITFLNE